MTAEFWAGAACGAGAVVTVITAFLYWLWHAEWDNEWSSNAQN